MAEQTVTFANIPSDTLGVPGKASVPGTHPLSRPALESPLSSAGFYIIDGTTRSRRALPTACWSS